MSFIENISADNLNMSEVEFNGHMGYVGGKTDTELLIEESKEDQQGREKLHVLQVRKNAVSQASRTAQFTLSVYKSLVHC